MAGSGVFNFLVVKALPSADDRTLTSKTMLRVLPVLFLSGSSVSFNSSTVSILLVESFNIKEI